MKFFSRTFGASNWNSLGSLLSSFVSHVFPLVLVCAGFAVSVCLIMTGCQNDLDGLRGVDRPGIDPPRDEFFFPTGLGLTEDTRYLFVSNGNADLKYNGGTINVIDLDAVARRLESGGGPGCNWDVQDPNILECEESGVIISKATLRVGNFPGAMEVLSRPAWVPESEPDGFGRQRIYVPVRGDPSLTYIDVIYDGPDGDSPIKCLSCGRSCLDVGEKIPDCHADHVISKTPDEAPYIEADLPAEPYGIHLERSLRLLYMTHLNNGALSLFDLSDDDIPVLKQVTAEYLSSGLDGRRGGFGVAPLRRGNPEGEIIVSNRVAPEMLVFKQHGASVKAEECSTGFCNEEVCSMCSSNSDCPGAQECVFDSGEGFFLCRGGEEALGDACDEGAECGSGFCNNGLCALCEGDEDCLGEQVCMEGGEGFFVCIGGERVLGRVCNEHAQCESGLCHQGRCAMCSSDDGCPGDQLCKPVLGEGRDWYHSCKGGDGIAGAMCYTSPRELNNNDPLLVYSDGVYLSVPHGPIEQLTAGDVRGLAVDPVEERLYALSRLPAALVVMDISVKEGNPRNEIINAIDLCLQPSNIKLHRAQDGRLTAYAVCWATGQVYALDPVAGDLIAVIPVGSGPHDMVFTPDDPWVPESLRSLGFISLFAENTIVVIDLDPQSPTWNSIIGRLGRPEKAVKQ